MLATTLEQSRKLVKAGINPNTADMHYAFDMIGGEAFQDIADETAILLAGNKNRILPYEPAWSLSALLELIPHDSLSKGIVSNNDWSGAVSWFCSAEDDNTNKYYYVTTADTAIDAAIKIVIKLKEDYVI